MAPLVDASRRRQTDRTPLSPGDTTFGVIDLSSDNGGDALVFVPTTSQSISSVSSSTLPSSTSTSSSSASSSIATSTSSTQVTSTVSTTVSSSTIASSSTSSASDSTITASSTYSTYTDIVAYTTTDSGSQTIVGSSTIVATQLFTMTPSPSPSLSAQQLTSNATSKKNTGAIAAGAVVGALCVLGMIAGLIFCVLRRNRRRRELDAIRVVSPFDAQPGAYRDIEQRSHTIRRVPPPAMDQGSFGSLVSIPSSRPQQQDPFADRYQVQPVQEEYDPVPLSPEKGLEQMQIRTASAALFNPFATTVAAFEPKSTLENGAYDGLEQRRGEQPKSAYAI